MAAATIKEDNGGPVSLIDVQKLKLLEKSKEEFAKQRIIAIAGLPDNADLEDLKGTLFHGYEVVDLIQGTDKSTATVVLGTPEQARNAVSTLNRCKFHDNTLLISPALPEGLLFIGNLPFDFTEEQLRDLMSPFGALERLFLVRSEVTGESKGYGFAQYISKECAGQAKQQLLSTGSKYIAGRILRVAFADTNLHTYADLHSRTLFVDKLPRDFTNSFALRQLFGRTGMVTYAQVAINVQTGSSRGFAFVDYATAGEAETGQRAHNGMQLEGSNIRVAYGSPGRSGESILGNRTNSLQGIPVPTGRSGSDNIRAQTPLSATGSTGPRPLMGTRPFLLPDVGPRGPLLPMPLMRHPMMGGPRMFPRPMFRGGPFHMGFMGPRCFMRGHRGPRPLIGNYPIRGPGLRGMGPRFRPRGPFAMMSHPRPPKEPMGCDEGGLPTKDGIAVQHTETPLAEPEIKQMAKPAIHPAGPVPAHDQPQQPTLRPLMKPQHTPQQHPLQPQPLIPGLSGYQQRGAQPVAGVGQVQHAGMVPGQGQVVNSHRQQVPGQAQPMTAQPGAIQPLLSLPMAGQQGVQTNQSVAAPTSQLYPAQRSLANGIIASAKQVQTVPSVYGQGQALMQMQPNQMQMPQTAATQGMTPQAVTGRAAGQPDYTMQHQQYTMAQQPVVEQSTITDPIGQAAASQEQTHDIQQAPQPLMQMQHVLYTQPAYYQPHPQPLYIQQQTPQPLIQAQQTQPLLQAQASQGQPALQAQQAQPSVQSAAAIQPMQSLMQGQPQQVQGYYIQQDLATQQQAAVSSVNGQNQWLQVTAAKPQMTGVATATQPTQVSSVPVGQWQQSTPMPLMAQPATLMAQPMSLMAQTGGQAQQQPGYGYTQAQTQQQLGYGYNTQYQQQADASYYAQPQQPQHQAANELAVSGQLSSAYPSASSMAYSQPQAVTPLMAAPSSAPQHSSSAYPSASSMAYSQPQAVAPLMAAPSSAPQHSAAPVMYGAQNPSEDPGVLKRALDLSAKQSYMGQSMSGIGGGYYEYNKRPRY